MVRFQFEGVHHWPGAPDGPVAYLRHPHRHVFHVEATREVAHDDRDVEVITLKRDMRAYAERTLAGPHAMSCEAMARDLANEFSLARCAVLEDGENGAEYVP